MLFAGLHLFAIHSVHRGLFGSVDGTLSPAVTPNGRCIHAICPGSFTFSYLWQCSFRTMVVEKTNVAFLVLGGAIELHLWHGTYPTEIFIRENSIVYINQGTKHLHCSLDWWHVRISCFFPRSEHGNFRSANLGFLTRSNELAYASFGVCAYAPRSRNRAHLF